MGAAQGTLLVLTPLVLTPLVLTPLVLTPLVLTPLVLTPLVLTPLMLQEMVETKGLAEDVADKIGEFVKLKGQFDLIEKLMAGPLGENKTGQVCRLLQPNFMRPSLFGRVQGPKFEFHHL